MNGLGDILKDTVTRLFGDLVTKELQGAAEAGDWPQALWEAVEQNGLTQPLVPEDAGGVGATWTDAYIIARAAGYFGAPIPLVETVLASRILADAGIAVPPGALTLAPVRDGEDVRLDGDRIVGRVSGIPWGIWAGHVVVVTESKGDCRVVLATTEDATEDRNIAREPRDTLDLARAAVVASAPCESHSRRSVRTFGAMLRTAQMAGGLSRILDEAVQYAQDRVQFGRPIAKFQAIQHQLAVLAGKSAQASVAAEAAFVAADRGDPWFEVASAKVVVGDAVGTGVPIAHQVHGAIGFTYEHALHFTTRRLWSWRAEFGAEAAWAEALGRAVCARGADAMWADLTARQASGAG